LGFNEFIPIPDVVDALSKSCLDILHKVYLTFPELEMLFNSFPTTQSVVYSHLIHLYFLKCFAENQNPVFFMKGLKLFNRSKLDGKIVDKIFKKIPEFLTNLIEICRLQLPFLG